MPQPPWLIGAGQFGKADRPYNMKNETRRKFIKHSVLGGLAALALPNLLPSSLWAAEVQPSARLTMGFIGMGKQSRGLLRAFLGQDTQVVAVCDVDTTRRNDAKATVTHSMPGRADHPPAVRPTMIFAN
jgi:hypothetical protein